jgi:DNA polymerase-3 subunit epsilon
VEFVAIDFETANRERGSICSIGFATVSDGAIKEQGSWLVQPPASMSEFDPWNVRIHGITADQVAGAPSIQDGLARLWEVIGDRTVVVHNAAFDMYALRDACWSSNVEHPPLTYADTLVMSRRELALISYRLPIVADALGVALPQHHRAEDDAAACAGIMLALAARRGAGSVDEVAEGLRIRLGQLNPDGAGNKSCYAQPIGSHGGGPRPDAPDANPNADPEHPLYGQVMVFTGALALTRTEAWDWAASVGAQPEENVTKRTTILVIGNGFQGDSMDDFQTGKAKKALGLLEKGQQIEVMTEEQFMESLGDAPSPSN